MSAPLCNCSPPQVTTKATSHSTANPGRKYWSCRSCDFFKWVDAGGANLSAPGPPCSCGHPSRRLVSKPTAKNPNRAFWTCASTDGRKCNFFLWAEEAPEEGPEIKRQRLLAGPKCSKCSTAVAHNIVKKDGDNKGRTFYKCEKCKHFEFLTARPMEQPCEETPGSVEYLVDEFTRRNLQALFEIPPQTNLSVGRDICEGGDHDHLRVECAWRVSNLVKRSRYQAFMPTRASLGQPSLTLRKAFAEAGDELLKSASAPSSALDRVPHEFMLIHGTKPENLYGILFEGLDPALSHCGLFGSGAYLAEDAAKIDQYVTVDAKWHGKMGDEAHPLHKLHKKLYETGIKHPGDVYYALVCRVKFDSQPAITKDGETVLNGSDFRDNAAKLFKDQDKRILASGKHSLVAELGSRIHRFREFVIFKPEAILIEYLVALKRERFYCNCGERAVERTVVKNNNNQGRKCLFCPTETCGFFQMYPMCHCGRSAEVAFKRDGSKYYRCGSRRDFCDFKGWTFP